MLILITSAIRKLNISTWFLTLTKHCVDQDPLGGHILQLIRMILKNYFTIRLHHIIWVNKKMADDVEVCVVCSDNFIVNSKCIGCKLCRKKFHLICVGVKNSWQKLLVDVMCGMYSGFVISANRSAWNLLIQPTWLLRVYQGK